MPDFTPSRSDAIREELIRHAAASLHGRATVGSTSASAPTAIHADPSAPRPARRPQGMRWAAATLALILVGGVVGLTATAALNAGTPTASTPTPSETSTTQPTTTPTPPSVHICVTDTRSVGAVDDRPSADQREGYRTVPAGRLVRERSRNAGPAWS